MASPELQHSHANNESVMAAADTASHEGLHGAPARESEQLCGTCSGKGHQYHECNNECAHCKTALHPCLLCPEIVRSYDSTSETGLLTFETSYAADRMEEKLETTREKMAKTKREVERLQAVVYAIEKELIRPPAEGGSREQMLGQWK
jgi:hypothetical protein